MTDSATQGVIIRYTEAGAEIDGHFVPALTILEAARRWWSLSNEKGWDLRNAHGLALDKLAYWADYWAMRQDNDNGRRATE